MKISQIYIYGLNSSISTPAFDHIWVMVQDSERNESRIVSFLTNQMVRGLGVIEIRLKRKIFSIIYNNMNRSNLMEKDKSELVDIILDLQKRVETLEQQLKQYSSNGPPPAYVNCRDQCLRPQKLIF